jgi:hypothetical protein
LNFEEALVEELSSLEGLNDRVFPLSASEGIDPPFVIYFSSEGDLDQDLSGVPLGSRNVTCEVHIVANSYGEMKDLVKAVISRLQSFFGRPIGTDGPLIRSFSMDSPLEAAEEEVGYSRCSFDIRVRY